MNQHDREEIYYGTPQGIVVTIDAHSLQRVATHMPQLNSKAAHFQKECPLPDPDATTRPDHQPAV